MIRDKMRSKSGAAGGPSEGGEGVQSLDTRGDWKRGEFEGKLQLDTKLEEEGRREERGRKDR